MSVDIIQGDARVVLERLPPASVHCVITSPPYYSLRHYGGGAQEMGQEATPQEYMAALVALFRAVHRVLRDDGTCWIVIGDGYANDTKWGGNGSGPTSKNWTSGRGGYAGQKVSRHSGFKPKDLMMIPHRVAIALQADGWYVRQELVWSKPAPMPESVTDRCTRSHEFVFMLAKQSRYYYDQDAIREAPSPTSHAGRRVAEGWKSAGLMAGGMPIRGGGIARSTLGGPARLAALASGRNRRTVWTIGSQPLGEEHYAACPEKLVEPMILAGTSEAGCCPRCLAPYRRVVERGPSSWEERKAAGHPMRYGSDGAGQSQGRGGAFDNRVGGFGTPAARVSERWQAGCACEAGVPIGCTTLDPFLGSGTTALVSKRLGRSCVGIELNPAYCDLARRRVESVPDSLFSAVSSGQGAAR